MQESLQGRSAAALNQHLGPFAIGYALGRHGHSWVTGDASGIWQVLCSEAGGVEKVLCSLLFAAFCTNECLKAEWWHGSHLALLKLLLCKSRVVVLLQCCK